MQINFKLRNKKAIASAFLSLLLVPLIGMISFVIDLGQAYTFKSRVKSALDLAALAGISQMESVSDVSNAKNKSVEFINNNLAATVPNFSSITLSDPDLEIQGGIYNFSTMTFTYDEVSSTANAIMISYSFPISTNFGTLFMIDTILLDENVIAAKQAAGEAAPKSSFPLALDTMALDTAIANSYMVDLYQSGGSKNSYFTAFDSIGMTNEIIDLFHYWGWGADTGHLPPRIRVGDTYRDHAGNVSSLYINIPLDQLENNTYIFPVVSVSGTTLTILGFVGATINDTDYAGQTFSITIIPKHIDNTHQGLLIGMGSNVDATYEGLLANAYGIVI